MPWVLDTLHTLSFKDHHNVAQNVIVNLLPLISTALQLQLLWGIYSIWVRSCNDTTVIKLTHPIISLGGLGHTNNSLQYQSHSARCNRSCLAGSVGDLRVQDEECEVERESSNTQAAIPASSETHLQAAGDEGNFPWSLLLTVPKSRQL